VGGNVHGRSTSRMEVVLRSEVARHALAAEEAVAVRFSLNSGEI